MAGIAVEFWSLTEKPPSEPGPQMAKNRLLARAITSTDIKDLLAILVRPLSQGPLQLSPSGDQLLSKEARASFPVIDGRPDLRKGAATGLFDPDNKNL